MTNVLTKQKVGNLEKSQKCCLETRGTHMNSCLYIGIYIIQIDTEILSKNFFFLALYVERAEKQWHSTSNEHSECEPRS